MSRESGPHYAYKRKGIGELRKIADQILKKYPARRYNRHAVNIEGIIEDFGIDIVFRQIPFVAVEAYVPQNPRLIVVNELKLYSVVRYRFTLAEELSHRILEFKLWSGDGIPIGGRIHELTQSQYRAIEQDAKALAAEIIEPEGPFRERYAHHYEILKRRGCEADNAIKMTIQKVWREFDVSTSSAALRAKKLGIIDAETHARVFPSYIM